MDDYQQIQNLIARYARLYDDGQFEAYGELFTHGQIGNLVGSLKGAAEVTAHHRKTCKTYDGKPNTRHVTTNTSIEVDAGGATASADSYFVVYQAAPKFPLQAIAVGSYFDTFHKIGGKWWFKTRQADVHLMGDVSNHSTFPPPQQEHLKTPVVGP